MPTDIRHRAHCLLNHLEHATIAFNTANNAGGGVFVNTTQPNIISNSLIANNFDISGSAPDISANFSNSTVTNSLIQDTMGINAGAPTNGVDGNIIGQDPLLGSLADNGGSTQTHALLDGSPAIDASDTSATTTDQRGVAAFGIRDIGAFEATPPTSPATTNNPIDPDTLPGGAEAESHFAIAGCLENQILTIEPELAEQFNLPTELLWGDLQCPDPEAERSEATDGVEESEIR